jgi:adhesin/invasin
MILVACGSAPTAPAPVVPAPTVATVTTTFGAVTGLPNGQATAPITVTALDANGNPVAGAPVSVALNGTLVGGVPTLVAGAVTNVSGFTGPTGTATLTITYMVAPGLTATATAGGITSPATATPVPVVARIIANNTPAVGVVADGYSNYTLTAYLYDAGNNLINGETVTFSATSQQNGQVGLSATTATSGVTGAVVVNVNDTSSIDDTVTVLVHALSDVYGAADYRAALTFAGSGTGSNPASNGETLRIVSVLPPTVPADGVTPIAVKVQARDVYSQVVAGMPIRMTSTLNGVVTPTLVNSDIYGFATFQVVDRYAETITLTASKNGVLPVSAAQGVVFSPYASTLTVTAVNNKTNIIANGVDSTTLTITATGPNGVVPNERISLSSSSNNTQLPALFVTTGANGQATTTVSDAVAERMTITATTRNGGALPGITVSNTIDLYAALAAPNMVFSAVGPFLADGATAGHALTLTVKNNGGIVQPNQPISFSLSTATAGIASQGTAQGGGANPTFWSDANGTINLFVSDSVAELVTLTATAVDGTVKTTTIQFVAANAAKVNVTASPTTAKPDGLTAITATANVTDVNNVAVANALVRFYSSDPYVNLSRSTALTSATGVATVNLTSFNQVLAADVYASLDLNGATLAQTPISFVEPVASVLLVADTLRARADGTAVITLKVRTLSAAGQPLVGRTVTFAHTSFATVSTPALTDIYGEASVTVTDNSVEAVTITASSEGVASAAQTLNFVPVVGSVAMSVVPVAANIPANGTSQASITATVLDAAGAPLSGQVVSFRDVYGSSALASAYSATTNAAGQATISLTDTINEAVSIQAQADIYSASSTINFVLANYNLNISSTASATCVGTGTAIGPCLANGSAQTINVSVNDTTTGLAQPGQPFNVAASGSAIALPSLITTASISPYQASFTLADTAAELVTVSLTDAAGVVSTRTVQFVSATANSVVLNADVLSVVPDGVSVAALSATVKDAAGGAVANALVYFSTTDPYAVLSTTQGLTNAAGVATATVRSSAETIAPITASLPLNGAAATNNTLNIAFEAPVQTVALVADTANLGVDAYATLTATVLDASSRPLVGRTVTFATTGVATLSSLSGVSDSYGNVQVTLSDSTAQAVTVSASVGAITSTPLTVTFTPLVGTMNLSVLPSSGAVPADGASTATIVVNLKDPYGSPIFGQSVQFLDDSYTSSVQISAATALTDATGTATITIKDVYAEAVTIRAIAGGQSKTGTVNFTLTNLQFVVGGAMPFLADGIQDHYVTVQASDKLGNPAAAQVFQVTTASQTMIPSQTQITTDANGFAQVSVSDFVAETANVTFSDGAALSFAVPVQFVAADPYSLSMTVTPANSVNPDGITPATVTVFVKDQYGAAVSNAWVALNTTGTAATLAGGNLLTNINGIATTTITSTVAGITTITASTPRNPTVTSVSASVTFEAPVAAVTLAANLLTVDAYGKANVASTITATVRDAAGAAIANRAVNFTVVSGQGSLVTLTGTTSATGTLSTDLYSGVGGVVQVTAKAGAVTSAPIAVTFVPVANTVSMTVAPNTQSVVADGVSTAIVTVNVKDANGVPIAGQAVQFFDDSFSSAVLSTTALTTNASGVATITVSDPVVEAVNIRAVVGSNAASWKQVSTTLQFVNSSIQLIVSGTQPFLADNTAHPLNLLVKDQYGTALTTPQAFTLSSSTATMIPSQLQVSTDATGNATVNVQDGLAETATLTLTHVATGLVFSVPVQFVSAAPNAMQVNVTPTTGVLPDGVSIATATVIVTDAYGAVVPNALVQFDVKNALGAIDTYATLSAATVVTNATGRAVVTISRTQQGITTLNVSLPRNTAIAAQAVDINFAGQVAQTPAKIALTASAYTLKSDGSDRITLTALVKDSNNVGVSAATVSFTPSSTGDAGVLSSNTAVTDAYGQAQVTLSAGTFDRSNRTINVTASVGALAPTPVLPIVVSGSTVVMQATPTSVIIADPTSASAVTMTVTDAGANPVANLSMTGILSKPNGVGVDLYSGATLVAQFPAVGTGSAWADAYTTTNTSGVATYDVYATSGIGGGTIVLTGSALGASASVSLTPSTPGNVFAIISPYKTPVQNMSLYTRQTVTVQASTQVIQNAIDLYTAGQKADAIARVKLSSSSGSWATTGGALGVDPYIVVAFPTVSPYTTTADFYASLPGTVTIQADDYVNAATAATVSDTLLMQVSAITPARVTLTSSSSTVAPSLGGQQQTATITATVQDANNFAVSNIPVTFSITAGPGGGERMQPVTVFTDAGGQAQSTFISGSLPSAQNGITVQGSVFSNGATISGTTPMTVGASAVSVSLGTSSGIASTPDGTSYILPMSALVTDVNGTAVAGAVVTLRVRPLYFAYGHRATTLTSGFSTGSVAYWPGYLFDTGTFTSFSTNATLVNTAAGFAAEDRNQNQILDVVSQGFPEDGYTSIVDFNSPFSGEITDRYTSYTYTDYANYYTGLTFNNYAQVDAYVYSNLQYSTNAVTGLQQLTSTTPGYISTRPDGTPSCQPFVDAYGNVFLNPTHWYCSTMADGVLSPAHASAGAVPTTVVTDAAGLASFNFTYQKRYARWLVVEISATIRNTAGTESVGKAAFQLSESITDTNLNLLAAYPNSPFGDRP